MSSREIAEEIMGNIQSRQQTENAMTKTVNNCKTYNIESMRFSLVN